MRKFNIENFDSNDTHSINVSVYKPDGILSFWNWFSRKNKNDGQRKNIKFKINKEDLDRIKASGFDFQKLQNIDLSNKNKSTRQCNVFAIPKTDLDPFLVKNLHPSMNTKTYVKRLISKSTISIRSKESCSNLKYVRTVRSQKSVVNNVQSSKTSFKVRMKSSTNVNLHLNQEPRNVFLKSVPTTILKSNTKKLLIIGKGKSPKEIRSARTNAPDNLKSQPYAKQNSSVIPMLLTRMKSMEEHLSDIENTTKKINEAVSQRNVIANGVGSTERNRQKAVKCVPSHKIYSKNIHVPRKNKKNRSKKKLKNKSKTNVLNLKESPLKLKQPNKGFAFNYFSDSSNEFKPPSDIGNGDTNHNNPKLSVNQPGFAIPKNISRLEFSPENTSKVGCDLIMSVVKALTETKGSTNLRQIDTSTTASNLKYPNVGAEVGVINLGVNNVISKSTFDWKHTSVSTSSEPLISETGKPNKENIKVQKNVSVTFGKQDVSHVPCTRNDILNQIFNPILQKQIVMELLKNTNIKSLPVQDETNKVGDVQTCYTGNSLGKVLSPNSDLEVTECIGKNNNVDETQNPQIKFQEEASTLSYLYQQNCVQSTKFTDSYIKTRPNQGQFHDGKSQENETLTKVPEMQSCAEQRSPNLQSCDENVSEITIDPGALCSVSIKQNAVPATFASSPEKQFKRTTISCSDAKKDPKVSITILVQDSMKDKVEMKSNLLKNRTVSKDERAGMSLKEAYSPPLNSVGPRGDQLWTVQSNACKSGSLCSVDNASSVSHAIIDKKAEAPVPKIIVEESPYSRTNKNFCVEVEDEEIQSPAEEDLNLGSPGTYLNYEKRKVLEEKALGFKQHRSLVQTECEEELLPPTRSRSIISNGSTSFDHMIETSFIRQETSYSKTKFNICKENKYSSRTSLKSSESCKRCHFSDDALSTGNNFDISTKFTSQQCVMYCRNNNVSNFKRPKLPLFSGRSLENTEFERRRQPFIVVHTPDDSSVVDTSNKSLKVRRKVIGLNLREDPILEVSEDETLVENKAQNEQHITEQNDFERKSSDEGLKCNLESIFDNGISSGSDINILGDIQSHDQKVHANDSQIKSEDSASEVKLQFQNNSIKCGGDLSDSVSKDPVGLTTNEARNRRGTTTLTSRISQTILSSTFVQTDWSLVGITVDHLNCSSNKSETIDCQKRTIGSQTEVRMDQIDLMNKDLEDMYTCCKSCMKSGQFSELVACNVATSQAENLQKAPRNLGNRHAVIPNDNTDVKELEVVDTSEMLIKGRDTKSVEYNASALPVHDDTLGSHLLEQSKNSILSSSVKKYSYNLQLSSQFCENYSEESLNILNEDSLHRCTIPCFTTLSDETVTSSLSGTPMEVHRNPYGGVVDLHTIPQIHAINRGICSYYASPGEKRPLNQLTPIEESRSSTPNTNTDFCRVICELDVDNEKLLLDENYPESQTSLAASEGDKDSKVDRMDMNPDYLGRSEDVNKQYAEDTKFELSSEIRKENENTKAQGRKIGLQSYTTNKAGKKESSSFEKSTDYMVKYLSIERCDDEKKGNSVFSQT